MNGKTLNDTLASRETVGIPSRLVGESDPGYWMFVTAHHVVLSRPEAHQLTIHYKDGETFHVKHAKDIRVVKHHSGGYDMEYVYTKRVNTETDFGEESSISEISVKTSTHDVIGLTLESRKDQEVYMKEYVGFGG